MSAPQAAARFGVGVSSAIRWIARAKIGELEPRPQGRGSASQLDEHEAFIVALIDERKDITLNEMVVRLAVARSVRISHSALSAWLRGNGWTYKKVMPSEAGPNLRGFGHVSLSAMPFWLELSAWRRRA